MRSMTGRRQKSATRLGAIRAVLATVAALLTGVALATTQVNEPSAPPAPLAVDVAFASLAMLAPGKIVVKFDVLPGHYLYRDRFEVQANGVTISSVMLPKGKLKTDPNFGRVEVYEQPFTLSAPTKIADNAELKLVFQGCSELAGVCYPPTTRTFALTAGAKEVRAKELAPVSLKQLFKPQVSQ